jgi:hypothetical protein
MKSNLGFAGLGLLAIGIAIIILGKSNEIVMLSGGGLSLVGILLMLADD